MPIFRINTDLHYFAHVPKCGGTAIEAYLTERFGPLGFLEKGRYLIPLGLRWNRTSCEHVSVQELQWMIPDGWLVSSFAVVRHPVPRLISAFFFSRDITGRTALSADFNTWALDMLSRLPDEPYLLEGHLRLQSLLVPDGARVFRLEDGLEPIVPYLDSLAGDSAGPREIAPRNVGKWRHDETAPELSTDVLDLIGKVYADDFRRFGYDIPATPTAAADLPGLPVLTSTGRPPVPGRRQLLNRIYRGVVARIERQ